MLYKTYEYCDNKIKIIIEEDVVGCYLFFFDEPKKTVSKEDYLFDSLEEALEEAKKRFGISFQQMNLTNSKSLSD